jgi:hypothetical protein
MKPGMPGRCLSQRNRSPFFTMGLTTEGQNNFCVFACMNFAVILSLETIGLRGS